MTNPYDFSAEADATNEELAGELAKYTTLSAADVQKLLPRKQDKQNLAQLIAIVNAAASTNDKVASLRSNLESLGGVVIKLLKTVIR